MSYATKLEQGIATVENPVKDIETLQTLDSCSSLPMDWALKSASTQRTRLTESQKQYLTEVFQIGKLTGHKADPCNVSKSMRKARNADGSCKPVNLILQAILHLSKLQVFSHALL